MLRKYYVQYVEDKTASDAASSIAINGQKPIYGTADMTSDTIIKRTYPDYRHKLYQTGVVVMYPDGIEEDKMLTARVPNMYGMSAIECIEACKQANLNIEIDGEVTGVCVDQQYPTGKKILAGDIVKVKLGDMADVPAGNNPTPTPRPTPAISNDRDDNDTDPDDQGEDGVIHEGDEET